MYHDIKKNEYNRKYNCYFFSTRILPDNNSVISLLVPRAFPVVFITRGLGNYFDSPEWFIY